MILKEVWSAGGTEAVVAEVEVTEGRRNHDLSETGVEAGKGRGDTGTVDTDQGVGRGGNDTDTEMQGNDQEAMTGGTDIVTCAVRDQQEICREAEPLKGHTVGIVPEAEVTNGHGSGETRQREVREGTTCVGEITAEVPGETKGVIEGGDTPMDYHHTPSAELSF